MTQLPENGELSGMSILRIKLLIIFVVFFLYSLNAMNAVERIDQKKNGIEHKHSQKDAALAIKTVKYIYKKVADGKVPKFKAVQYLIFANKINDYAKLENIEILTNYKRSWFTLQVKVMTLMYKYRKQMEIADINKSKKEYITAQKKYSKLLLKLQYLIKNRSKFRVVKGR